MKQKTSFWYYLALPFLSLLLSLMPQLFFLYGTQDSNLLFILNISPTLAWVKFGVGFSFLFLFQYIFIYFKSKNWSFWSFFVYIILLVIGAFLWQIIQGMVSDWMQLTPLEEYEKTLELVSHFTVLVVLFLAHSFLQSLYQTQFKQLEIERLSKLQSQTKMQVLEAQTDPHFLYNSLNVLHSLIRTSPTDARKFTLELSHLYRKMQTLSKQPFNLLNEEIDFAKNYLFLMKTRFPEGFEVEWDIQNENKKIAGLSLQMALENIFKHNQISPQNPLKIELTSTTDYLTITNPIVPKKSMEGNPSTQLGLSLLKKKYEAILNKKVQISTQNNLFSLQIPLV